MFFSLFRWWRDLQQKPESGTGRTSAHCLPSRSWVFWFATSPPRYRPPSGPTQLPGHFIWQLLISTMFVYMRHTVWQKYLVVGILKYFAVSQNWDTCRERQQKIHFCISVNYARIKTFQSAFPFASVSLKYDMTEGVLVHMVHWFAA
jgi:hypothetical protein